MAFKVFQRAEVSLHHSVAEFLSSV